MAMMALALSLSGLLSARFAALDSLAALLPMTLPLGLAALILSSGRTGRHPWRPGLRSIALIAMLTSGYYIYAELSAVPPVTTVGVPVRILTHNLHHGGTSPAMQARLLAKSGADILLLQENDQRSAAALASLSNIYPYRDTCGACELAILSRWPIDGVHWRLPVPDGQPGGPALFRTHIEVPGAGPLTVATIHAPRPYPVARHQAFFDQLITAMAYQPGRAMILAGDFNQTPWSATMRHVDRGLAPLRRVTRALFSYPSILPIVPIDHIFTSPDIGVKAVTVMPSSGSDHRPVMVEARMPFERRSSGEPSIASGQELPR